MFDKHYDIFSFISQNYIYTTHPIHFLLFFLKELHTINISMLSGKSL